jgi:hypothetical protein
MSVTTAVIGAAASVVNNTVSNLMQQPMQKAKIESIRLQDRLSQLSNEQQYVLALRLQKAQTANEQMQILSDSVSQIDVATVTGNANILAASVGAQSKNTMATALIIVGSVGAVIVAYYFLNKKD